MFHGHFCVFCLGHSRWVQNDKLWTFNRTEARLGEWTFAFLERIGKNKSEVITVTGELKTMQLDPTGVQNETSFWKQEKLDGKPAHLYSWAYSLFHPTSRSNTQKGRTLMMKETGNPFCKQSWGFTAWTPVTSFLVCISRVEQIKVHAHKYAVEGRKRASKATWRAFKLDAKSLWAKIAEGSTTFYCFQNGLRSLSIHVFAYHQLK